MGLSETILAAMIGAIATVSGALFQIFTSMKSRNKIDARPRRGSIFRSVLAVFALMVASAVGGFLYSEFLKQRGGEDLRAMRMELRELKDLATAARTTAPAQVAQVAPAPDPVTAVVPVALHTDSGRAESVAYVPACRKSASTLDTSMSCAETDGQRIALCSSIPAYARIEAIDLYAQPDAVQRPWDDHRAALEQDVGGARFTGKSFEYAQNANLKAVCVNFVQWSSDHSYIARIVVNYASGEQSPMPVATVDSSMNALDAVVSAEAASSATEQATLVTNTTP